VNAAFDYIVYFNLFDENVDHQLGLNFASNPRINSDYEPYLGEHEQVVGNNFQSMSNTRNGNRNAPRDEVPTR
jgi:hypothetical protein